MIYSGRAPIFMSRTEVILDPYESAVSGDSPVAWWRMHETSGNLVDEISSLNLTPNGSPVYNQAGPLVGQTTASIEFNTTDRFSALGTPLGTGNIDTYSIEIWYYREATATQVLFAQQNSGSNNINCSIAQDTTNGRISIDEFPPTGPSASSDTNAVNNEWLHVIGVSDSANTELRIYFDGFLDRLDPTLETFTGSGIDSVTIGRRLDNVFGVNGRLSDISIYTTALTDAQARAHYEGAGIRTWSVTRKDAAITLSGGNLTEINSTGAGVSGIVSSKGYDAGKKYFEFTRNATADTFGGFGCLEVGDIDNAAIPGFPTDSFGWRNSDNTYYLDGVSQGASGLTAPGASDVIMVAADFNANKVWFGRNGTWDGDPGAGTGEAISSISSSGYFYASVATTSINSGGTVNFGGSAFTYTVPTGFSSWDSE